MIAPFRNHLPVKIRFGDGVAGELAEVLAAEGAARPFVIMDEGLDGFIPGVAATLDAVPGAIRFEKAPGEPTVGLVEHAAAALAESGADAVVAIGGGSSMDTAKAARLVAGQGGPYLRFAAGGVEYEAPALPLVCVPTTAGTGSEVSGGAVITDEATHVKAGIANPLLRAQHALVDPVLTHGLPQKLTAYTGIDALAQAIAGAGGDRPHADRRRDRPRVDAAGRQVAGALRPHRLGCRCARRTWRARACWPGWR